MDLNKLLALKAYLYAQGRQLPEYVEDDVEHWKAQIDMANLLCEMGKDEEAYTILRDVYEKSAFVFDKDIHGDYEDYIVEKVNFLKQLAKVSLNVTNEPARSIPYLDEALIILDGAESVYPYVNPKDIEMIKKSYLDQIK